MRTRSTAYNIAAGSRKIYRLNTKDNNSIRCPTSSKKYFWNCRIQRSRQFASDRTVTAHGLLVISMQKGVGNTYHDVVQRASQECKSAPMPPRARGLPLREAAIKGAKQREPLMEVAPHNASAQRHQVQANEKTKKRRIFGS